MQKETRSRGRPTLKATTSRGPTRTFREADDTGADSASVPSMAAAASKAVAWATEQIELQSGEAEESGAAPPPLSWAPQSHSAKLRLDRMSTVLRQVRCAAQLSALRDPKCTKSMVPQPGADDKNGRSRIPRSCADRD